jgi:CoA:oxalate CoA-transferase
MLEGTRVLDLTHDVAGPFAGKLLADFGAEVIKLEPPGRGDPARYAVPWSDAYPDEDPSPAFLALNAGKLGITLDLFGDRGRAIFERLVQAVDVVLEDADGAGRSPLSYEQLELLKPSLVLSSVSSYGVDRELPRHPALLEYARGGMLYATGERAEKPVQTPEAASYLTGLLAASGTIAAAYGAILSGDGEHVDVSAAEATLSVFYPQLARYAYQGVVGGRSLPQSIRQVADGWIYPNLAVLRSVARSQTPEAVANFLGAPELADIQARIADPDAWDRKVAERLMTLNRYDAMAGGQAAGLVWSVVQNPAEMLACEQLADRAFFSEADDARVGRLKYATNPALPESERVPERRPAPLLGEHNAAVYEVLLGMTPTELQSLAREGVI